MYIDPSLSSPSPYSSFRARKPTSKEAETTFWGLGDRFWMQFIDGKYHQFGPMVFDEALHKGPKEPGYFSSLKKGCEYAVAHLGEPLSLHFYTELHKILCSHFKGESTQTEMGADEAGTFRSKETEAKASLKFEFSKEAKEHYQIVYAYEYGELLDYIKNNNPERHKQICDDYPASKKWVEEWENHWENKVKALNEYIKEKCHVLNVSKFMHIAKYYEIIGLYYTCHDPKELEEITSLLLDKYNKTISSLNEKLKTASSLEESQKLMEEKLVAIAEVYQMLDWLHPFIDGQGRTDLMVLAKLLSEEGFNPSILEHPFFSSFATLPEWKEYLIQGMEAWRAERAK